jgi:hypothetical protein
VTPALVLAVLIADDAGEVPLSRPEAPPIVETRQRPPNIVVPALHGLAVMTVMRATESWLWPDPFSRPSQFAGRYDEAFTKPPLFDPQKPVMQWDGDPLAVNAFGHALFGSELYLRARQCRFGWAGSLAFAAATSAIWEYGFEANGARPSAVDLVYTPLAGLALGEVRYIVHRAAGHLSSAGAREVVRAVVDPLGELERLAGTDC